MKDQKQSLGLFDATTIVMGSMIGSGVFIVAADIGRQVGSPGMMLMAWVVTALLTLIAALSYGELAAMMPKAGGQYVYLREAFGPMYGFLYGWTFFTVIQTGTIAAVAVAFAKFLGVFVPDVPQKTVAIVLIVFLTWLNTRGLRTGALVQNVFTVAKTGALVGLIGAAILGPVAVQVMAAAIMVSTFGCANGLTLAGARVYYAMALDDLFFKQAARLDPKTQAPVTSLWIQCLWACGLTLTGSYSELLDYVIFAVLLFYILTIVGIFVLRRTRPDAERPYKAFGYPVLPALYIVLASGIELLLLLYKPSFTWPGLIIVLLGIPVYFWWTKGKVKA